MSNQKMIDGKLHIHCEEDGNYYPKYKTENGLRWELDEKYFIYVLEGDTVDESRERDKEAPYDLSMSYGQARERYLKENNFQLYAKLNFASELMTHLIEIDKKALEMEERLTEQFMKQEGVTAELKMQDQMGWVGRMNNIKHRVREIVQNELIFV